MPLVTVAGPGSRYRASAGASNWQDVTVGYSDMPAELGGTDGRKVRMDLTGTDWSPQLGTGASATRVVGGAFDGTDCVRLVPPTVDDNYACIMRFLDLSNGGAKNVAQVNTGFCIKFGSRYWDLGHTDKLTGVLASQTVGGAESASASRCGVFDAFNDEGNPTPDLRRIFSVTATTFASYTQPPNGYQPESGPNADKLLYLGDVINHASNPPEVGSEWLYFEQEVDYRQDRGSANGRNRLDVWARGGYLGYLEIELTWRPDWDFSWAYARYIEYIGGYWNNAGTADANNYLDVSHPIVSVNRVKDARIGPPPSFLT